MTMTEGMNRLIGSAVSRKWLEVWSLRTVDFHVDGLGHRPAHVLVGDAVRDEDQCVRHVRSVAACTENTTST